MARSSGLRRGNADDEAGDERRAIHEYVDIESLTDRATLVAGLVVSIAASQT